jgi:predicted XRE-type DNA-binding protein
MSMTDYTEGSGNVFADLGFADAEEKLAKAKLASLVNHIVEERKLTPAKAAKLLGLSQPQISDLTHGRLARFSLEQLFAFLGRLGHDIEIIVSRRPATRRSGEIHISAA